MNKEEIKKHCNKIFELLNNRLCLINSICWTYEFPGPDLFSCDDAVVVGFEEDKIKVKLIGRELPSYCVGERYDDDDWKLHEYEILFSIDDLEDKDGKGIIKRLDEFFKEAREKDEERKRKEEERKKEQEKRRLEEKEEREKTEYERLKEKFESKPDKSVPLLKPQYLTEGYIPPNETKT
jgi:hypothetical protein